jgi:hypothetical protein
MSTSISQLFIPLDGAMQFEVLLGPGMKKPEPELVVWVAPAIKRIDAPRWPGCTCSTGWPVIHFPKEHPLRKYSTFDLAVRRRKPTLVCKCVGRIIE